MKNVLKTEVDRNSLERIAVTTCKLAKALLPLPGGGCGILKIIKHLLAVFYSNFNPYIIE